MRHAITFFCLSAIAAAQTIRLDPQFVSANRAPETPELVAATVRVVSAEELRHVPSLALDGALRSVPAFSLFRRSDSLTANPTAQGVSLRGLGPSGASRSLVLLDDVPLNDPFGGWVAWTKVPREGLTRVELLPGGGATAWGNAALGGVIQLLTELPHQDSARLHGLFGDFNTRSAEGSINRTFGNDSVSARARWFATDGFSLVAPERRGPIDIPAWSRHRWINGRWRHTFDSRVQVAVNVRAYEEQRGNGTPYQRNASREKFASLYATSGNDGAFMWEATGYAQDQSFSSTFGAVNATRTAETPASDQFAVPSTAFGGAWTGNWRHLGSVGNAHTSAGADFRSVWGETRENFTFANGDFTRQRRAGGRQDVAGLFAFHERRLVGPLRLSLGARLDRWEESDGHRRETDRLTGATLRDDHYADRSGNAVSPSAGLVWRPTGELAPRLRLNVQRSYRRPTLNELYRPFRVGPNVTEANAALDTERATSVELGGTWHFLPVRPTAAPGTIIVSPHAQAWPRLTLGAVAFWNDLEDAVGNVTIARGPGTFPIVGFVAAGGVGRQRLNLDRARVQGLELSAKWNPVDPLTLTADFLYNDATVRRALLAPALVGRRLAQVPRQSAALSANWQAPGQFAFTPRVRWLGRQFEDDENQLILGEAVVVDFGVSRTFGATRKSEVFLNVENLGNTRLETGRSADGVVNVGTPRFVTGGLRFSW